MTNKTITAFFDSYEDAAEAVSRLENAGIPHRDVSLVANNKDDRYTHHTNGRMLDADRTDADDTSDGDRSQSSGLYGRFTAARASSPGSA